MRKPLAWISFGDTCPGCRQGEGRYLEQILAAPRLQIINLTQVEEFRLIATSVVGKVLVSPEVPR